MNRPYLERDQIAAIVERVGQPEGSELLNAFFNAYRARLKSADVAPLYDEEYLRRVSSHPVVERVGGQFAVNVFNQYSFAYLRGRLRPETRVLDVGCGNGEFALALAAEGAGAVDGVDFAAEAIRAASARAAESGLACRFYNTDVAHLPETGEYDFVVFNDVTEHLSDQELESLFRTVERRLAVGGKLVIHTPNGLALCNGTDRDLFMTLYGAKLRLRGWRGFERTIDQLYYDQVHINIKSFRQLRRLLRRCGFRARVRYDDGHLPRWKRRLSSNMLVVAERAAR